MIVFPGDSVTFDNYVSSASGGSIATYGILPAQI